jgi:hypothetical protein
MFVFIKKYPILLLCGSLNIDFPARGLGGAAFLGHFFEEIAPSTTKKNFGLPTGFYPPDKCFFVAVGSVGIFSAAHAKTTSNESTF